MLHWLTLLPYGKKLLGLNLAADWGLLVGGLHVLSVPAWVSYGCSGFLPQLIDIQMKSTGYNKLPIGVNVMLHSICTGNF